MARLPRLVIAHQVHVVIQRGLDHQPLFRDADDYRAMLAWLREGSRKFKCAIHAYALLPQAWYLLATPADDDGLGRMMQWIGRHYVPWYNQKYRRSGTLWQGRFKATVIDAEHYLLACTRYIETTLVEGDAAPGPGRNADTAWSSFAHHIGQQQDGLITEHALFWALGNTPFDREAAYRQLSQSPLPATDAALLRVATAKGWALGSEKFRHEIEKQAGRRVAPAARGRPPKEGARQSTAKTVDKMAKTALK
ncbi:MAG: transposase [Janthinobacterium lividum]